MEDTREPRIVSSGSTQTLSPRAKSPSYPTKPAVQSRRLPDTTAKSRSRICCCSLAWIRAELSALIEMALGSNLYH